MTLILADIKEGLKVRYIDKTWSNWYTKRNHLYGQVQELPSRLHSNEQLIKIVFYKDPDYEQFITSERWKIKRFILEDRVEENTSVPRTKLEKKCRKLWNNSNWVKADPSRAY